MPTELSYTERSDAKVSYTRRATPPTLSRTKRSHSPIFVVFHGMPLVLLLFNWRFPSLESDSNCYPPIHYRSARFILQANRVLSVSKLSIRMLGESQAFWIFAIFILGVQIVQVVVTCCRRCCCSDLRLFSRRRALATSSALRLLSFFTFSSAAKAVDEAVDWVSMRSVCLCEQKIKFTIMLLFSWIISNH